MLRGYALTYGLRLAVLAAALGLWQGLSAAGVIRADEFPSMSQTATALWDAGERLFPVDARSGRPSKAGRSAWSSAPPPRC